MTATFFATPAHLRRWLEKNHATTRELIVGFYKKGTGKPSIAWPELVDQVLCFGWIDGIRRTIDEEIWTIRITPRKPDSTWSNVNVGRAAEMTRLGLMKPAGLQAFRSRSARKTGTYTYENRPKKLTPVFEKPFKANANAWAFYRAQPPGYQRVTTYWVMSARREETRLRRLAQLIRECAAGKRLGLLSRKPAAKG